MWCVSAHLPGEKSGETIGAVCGIAVSGVGNKPSLVQMEKEQVSIHWFQNDLRLHDQPVLANREGQAFLGIYILNPLWFKDHRLGFSLMGQKRLRFLTESLVALRKQLRAKGSDLLLFYAPVQEVFEGLKKRYNIVEVSTPSAYALYEKRFIQQASQVMDMPIRQVHNTLLIHPSNAPFPVEKVPFVFSSFRKAIEKTTDAWTKALPAVKELPPLPKNHAWQEGLPSDWPPVDVQEVFHPHSVIPFAGGEETGLARLEHYVASHKVAHYKQTRNGLVGVDYSTKFSIWLAHGCLSPRTICNRIRQYETEVKKNSSTYWVIFELLWRDFFAYQAMRYGNRFFYASGLLKRPQNPKRDRALFRSWCEGQTADDFVNANMRELKATGFMSNRGRQNVASYLVHDLGLDWRWGAYWFQHHLVDFDVHSNWGNWMYVAGVGNDSRKNRRFDVVWQAHKYDKNKAYRKLWT